MRCGRQRLTESSLWGYLLPLQALCSDADDGDCVQVMVHTCYRRHELHVALIPMMGVCVVGQSVAVGVAVQHDASQNSLLCGRAGHVVQELRVVALKRHGKDGKRRAQRGLRNAPSPSSE